MFYKRTQSIEKQFKKLLVIAIFYENKNNKLTSSLAVLTF